MSYIRDDFATKIPIQGGELILSPAYDILHYFPPLGAFMLKYFKPDGTGMSDVLLDRTNAEKLAHHAGLIVVERQFILRTEHERMVEWQLEQFDQTFGS